MATSGSDDLNQTSISPRSGRRRKRRLEAPRAEAAPNAANQPDSSDRVVHSLRPKSKPLWLTLLLRLQQGSSIATLALVASVLAVYSWTVYIQQRWGQEYDKLETLKKQERQLISANEVLKNQMAEQAEKPTAGLLLPDPSNAIFLTPAPQRPEVKPKTPLPLSDASKRPLGY